MELASSFMSRTQRQERDCSYRTNRIHIMFFVSGDAVKSWGANLPGSPVIAGDDPEERVTVFMVLAGTWSHGMPGPSSMH